MKKSSIIRISFAVFILFLFLSSASAITASIGNSKMVLRANVGETIERSILVKNVNDERVMISIFASGDLAKNVDLKETNFTLEPGEERKVFFTIKATKAGTTETSINVGFKPLNGPGVGLSSTVILIAKGETVDTEESVDSGEGFISRENMDENLVKDVIFLSPITPLIISTVVLSTILLILILYFRKKKLKKGVRRPHD